MTERHGIPLPELWLVTGASSGIGTQLAKTLARPGRVLALSGRDANALDVVRGACLDLGAEDARIFPEDLSAPDGPERLARTVQQALGDPVGLINDAGISTSEPVIRVSLADIRDQLAVNMGAPLVLTRLLAPAMSAKRRGFILNVASLAGFQALPRQAVYAATKGFLVHWTTALRRELLPRGVHVTALCPGLTRTPFFARSQLRADNRWARLPGTWSDPADVARAGIDGVMRNKMLVTPGLMNRVGAALARQLPRSFVRRLVAWGCHE